MQAAEERNCQGSSLSLNVHRDEDGAGAGGGGGGGYAGPETAEREGVWLIFIGHKFAKIFERDVDGP